MSQYACDSHFFYVCHFACAHTRNITRDAAMEWPYVRNILKQSVHCIPGQVIYLKQTHELNYEWNAHRYTACYIFGNITSWNESVF